MYESTDFDDMDEDGAEVLLPGLRGWNAGLMRALWPSGRGGGRGSSSSSSAAASTGARLGAAEGG
jgi:hypothetical protein